jgi:hypothetical protein
MHILRIQITSSISCEKFYPIQQTVDNYDVARDASGQSTPTVKLHPQYGRVPGQKLRNLKISEFQFLTNIFSTTNIYPQVLQHSQIAHNHRADELYRFIFISGRSAYYAPLRSRH